MREGAECDAGRYVNLTGIGRSELLRSLDRNMRALADAYARLVLALREVEERFRLHKEVQARCTELLTEVRAYRASGICLPGWRCFRCGAFNGTVGSMGRERKECRICGEAP